MTDWVRLWHDMPTDPKWRVIARKSGQPLPCVIALFTFLMTTASAADERGSLHDLNVEDAAAALDMDEDDVSAILAAMDGRVIEEGRLSGWERRQPKREDSSNERVKAFRERKKAQENDAKRDVTQCNAPETDTEEDTEDTPHSPPSEGKGKGKTLLPEDWQLPAVADLGPKARACAEQWTQANYETHGEAFVSYWRSERKMKADWRGTWANRVISLHSQVMRDQKFGNGAPTAKPSDAPKVEWTPEARAAHLRAAAALRRDDDPDELARVSDRPGFSRPIGELVTGIANRTH